MSEEVIKAHIINRPGHEVGDKALAMCGVEHKVGIKWKDLPEDHPICRDCVDIALESLTEVSDTLSHATRQALFLLDALTAETDFSSLVDAQRQFNAEQEAKAIAKAEKKQAKKDKKAEKKAEVLLAQMAGDAHPQYRPGFEGAVLSGAVNTQEELDSWKVRPPIAPEED